MKNNQEYKGEWFLPIDKSKRITGTLYFDTEQGGRLELIGSFADNLFKPDLDKTEVILGVTSDSKYLTLYNSFITKSTGPTLRVGNETGKPLTTYVVNFILEGIHVDNIEELKFEKIISEINNLDEWLDISGFDRSEFDLEKFKRHEIEIKYKLPEQINFEIDDNLNGQFNFIANNPGLNVFDKELTIKQKVEIIINSNQGFTIENGLKHLFAFQNFIILGLYQHTYPISIKLRSTKFETILKDDTKIPIDVKLFFAISDSYKKRKNRTFHDMLFSYGHIKCDFNAIIKNWYEKYTFLEPAFELVFEQFYNNERFSTNTFLNLAQAAETFHARTNNHTKIPKDDYKKMKEDILKLTPEQYHNWLNDQFNFGNNLNLHARLSEICVKYSNKIIDKLIGDKDMFVKKVKYSRNYYTHYSDSSKSNAAIGEELYFLSEKLKILLVSAFLIEVGFDKTLLENLLENNKYRFFNHLTKW